MENSRRLFSLLDDEPIACPEDDTLGTGKAALRLAGLLVASREATPLTLAVDADWGSGKSSLMRMLESELAMREDVHTVWFNAWSATQADALEGIIKSVLMRFDRRLLRRALQQMADRRAVLGVARVAATFAASAFGVTGLVDQLWNRLSASPQSRNEMATSLRSLTREWSESGPYTPRRLLVVFIDDLDRCPPETVLAVCEAVKVYLDVPGLAFVIGCDRSALTEGGILESLSPGGVAFMEKIFQTNYRLPLPTDEEAAGFVRECARRSGIAALLTTDLVHLLVGHANRNPRRIKRIINGLALESTLNPVWRDVDDSSIQSMVRVILLQYLYPGFYRDLAGNAPQRNLIRDFLLYRKAMRSALGPEDGSVEDEEVDSFYVDHDVSPPYRNEGEDPGDLFGKLELRLPSSFATLAYDRAFVALTEQLWESGAGSLLLRQVLSRPPERVTAPAEDMSDAADETLGISPFESSSSVPYSRKSVLWIDDAPTNNSSLTASLRQSGARVVIAMNGDEAMQCLADRKWDLIISDVTRNGDQEAGFKDLERFHRAGLTDTPVIFYTSGVTSNRQKKATAMGALLITSSPYEFRRISDKVLSGT
ncbi:hypothetical protein GCM10023224_14130 [Streptomonospora halophila]|uniref:Response regulatory domain-containing protein n=1 Tax=Streptomonospora halophila TaxID=427369 RepID=A0ABP9GAG7_9ACTN